MTNARKSMWRRVCGRAATVAAWFLVLLALGVAGLWVDLRNATCLWYSSVFPQRHSGYHVSVFSGGHAIQVYCGYTEFPPELHELLLHGWSFAHGDINGDLRDRIWIPSRQSCGLFGLERIVASRASGDADEGITYWLMFPHWFVLLLLLPWPAMRGWGWLTLRRRRRKGLCVGCGYDLRASPERCPECGMEKTD